MARLAAGMENLPSVTMGGKTDPQIITEMLSLAGLSPRDITSVMPCALAEAERTLADCHDRLRQEGVVHPGVRELLVRLADTSGVRQKPGDR